MTMQAVEVIHLLVKFQTTVIGAPAGCGYLTPKFAMPLTTLSIHLRISASFNNCFMVLLSILKLKNKNRIIGTKAADVNKHLSQ
jgi:hypothetical protein